MNQLSLLRKARNLLTIMVLLFCFSWVADLEAQQGIGTNDFHQITRRWAGLLRSPSPKALRSILKATSSSLTGQVNGS